MNELRHKRGSNLFKVAELVNTRAGMGTRASGSSMHPPKQKQYRLPQKAWPECACPWSTCAFPTISVDAHRTEEALDWG